MATITNTMDRVVSNSKRQNHIMQILIKSFLVGIIGYAVFILTIIGSFHLISSMFSLGSAQINGAVLTVSSVGYLALYSFLLIKEMRLNNFCK